MIWKEDLNKERFHDIFRSSCIWFPRHVETAFRFRWQAIRKTFSAEVIKKEI